MNIYTAQEIAGDWEWKPLPKVGGRLPGRLIIFWGHMNIEDTTYSERLVVYTLTKNYEGINLARNTRILAIYT